jgi:hypothetical protein
MIALATTIAFVCGLVAGLPQIARMVRRRDSKSQSATGWAMGVQGAVATAYLGAAKGVALVVYAPSVAGAMVAALGLAVTLYYADRPHWAQAQPERAAAMARRIGTAMARALGEDTAVHLHSGAAGPYVCERISCTSPSLNPQDV